MLKLLIADDNAAICDILQNFAAASGYDTIIAGDGEAALQCFEANAVDLVLLDVMMPKLDGFSVCRRIREISDVPIIMITARGEDFDKIMGLDIGADDYVVKPFSVKEVMARVRAILRRLNQTGEESRIYKVGKLSINMEDYRVTLDDHALALTKKEIELLWTFAKNKNKVFTRENLLDSIWGYEYCGDSRTVDSHIKRLRAKLDEYAHPEWDIKTIWGVGYRFEESKDEK